MNDEGLADAAAASPFRYPDFTQAAAESAAASRRDDDVRRLVGRQRVRVDDQIVVRRQLLLDAIEALEVVRAARVVVSDEPRGVGRAVPPVARDTLDSDVERRGDQGPEDVSAAGQGDRRRV